MKAFYEKFMENYNVKLLGRPKMYLGWRINTTTDGAITLSQSDMAEADKNCGNAQGKYLDNTVRRLDAITFPNVTV